MRPYRFRFPFWLGLFSLAGCAPPAPTPPPDSVTRGMADALIDTGFYSDVAITRTIGRHYNPAEDAWTIVACYDFALTDGRQGAACVDSFSAMQLENDVWVVGTTINEVYRWRAIGITPEAADAPGSASPAGQPADRPPEQTSGPAPEAVSEPPAEEAPEQTSDPESPRPDAN